MFNVRPLTFQLEQDSLFKYCDAHGIDILQSLRLKVSPPNQFNDPFEFLPKVDCTDETDVKKELTDRKLLRSTWKKERLQVPFEEFYAEMRKALSEDVSRVQRRLQDLALQSQNNVVDFLSKTYALACFSEVSDNLLMWSHYADGHRGIVVKLDVTNSFFLVAPGNLMPVSYRSERINASFDSEDLASIQHESLTVMRVKSLAWSYEREWRQLFEAKDCTKMPNPDGTTRFYVSIPSDAIASVIFGIRCRAETEKIVRDLKKRPDLQHVRLSRAVLHERDFKINVVPADEK